MKYRNRIDTDLMRRLWEEGLDDVQIAAVFGVSKQAVHFRRMDLNLPAQRHRKPILAVVQAPPRPTPTPDPHRAAILATGGRYAALADLAREKGWSTIKAQIEWHKVSLP